MARKSKIEKAAEKLYYEYFDGVQVDIFSLGKIHKEICGVLESGAAVEVEVPKLVAQYREN